MDFGSYVAAMQAIDGEVDRLRREWRHRSLVHADLREDNLLFGEPGTAEPAVRIVDWELAGFGDPRYDVGVVVGQLLLAWLRAAGDVRGVTGAADDAWPVARRNVGVFLAAYRQLATTTVGADDDLPVLRYAGLFLVQQAVVRLERIGEIGRLGHLCLLVGGQLVRRPDAAAELLLRSPS